MITSVYMMARQPWQPQPVLQLVDLAGLGEPNSQGLAIGPTGPFWIDPESLWWVLAARAYLRQVLQRVDQIYAV
jgi:hypothetical protein